MEPLVSILLPVYNCERFIALSITSILQQSYKNIEIIIVNDGSTDSTEKIILSFNDPRIKYYKNEINSRIVKTLNRAVELSNGKYLARMDADDIALKDRINEQVNFLEKHEDYIMVDCVQKCIDEKGNDLNVYNSNVIDENEILKTLPKKNCLGHPSMMMRRDIYLEYKYRNIVYEDYDLWLRLINAGYKIYKIPKPLMLFRVHSLSITGGAQHSNIHFFNIAKTKWFYFSKLKFIDKIKPFNLKLFFWTIIDYFTAYYKRLKSFFK